MWISHLLHGLSGQAPGGPSVGTGSCKRAPGAPQGTAAQLAISIQQPRLQHGCACGPGGGEEVPRARSQQAYTAQGRSFTNSMQYYVHAPSLEGRGLGSRPQRSVPCCAKCPQGHARRHARLGARGGAALLGAQPCAPMPIMPPIMLNNSTSATPISITMRMMTIHSSLRDAGQAVMSAGGAAPAAGAISQRTSTACTAPLAT